MERRSGSVRPDEPPPGSGQPGGPPFRGPGLLARAGPFALVAIAAEASLALPPGTHAWPAVTVSVALLAAAGLAFLLPWDRIPGWAAVLVPLAFVGWALALTLAAGAVSGADIVVLIPLIWTVLFHRPPESACVLVALVASEVVISAVQSAPDTVIIRRVVLWGVLGTLLAVAAHGLRDRIRQSQQAAARLQEHVGELMVLRDRDRLAADLQSSVVQRIFAAGLKLQGAASLARQAEVRCRVESSVTDLDDAIRLLRQAIFGLENRLDDQGLRQQVVRLCATVSPVPEITFAGQVDEALPPESSDQALDMLRLALGAVGRHAAPTSIGVEAAADLSFIVTADGDTADGDLSPFLDRASVAGLAVEIESVPGGTRLSWKVPARA